MCQSSVSRIVLAPWISSYTGLHWQGLEERQGTLSICTSDNLMGHIWHWNLNNQITALSNFYASIYFEILMTLLLINDVVSAIVNFNCCLCYGEIKIEWMQSNHISLVPITLRLDSVWSKSQLMLATTSTHCHTSFLLYLGQ